MKRLSGYYLTFLLLCTLTSASCSVAERSETQVEGLEPILFDRGEEPGQLYYEYDPMGMHVLPEALVVDGNGSFYFLESELRRVQAFDSEGEFITMLDAPESLAASESAYPAGLAIDPDGNLCVLWAMEGADEDGLQLVLLRHDSSGAVISTTNLIEAEEPITEVISCKIDEQGFIWILSEAATSVFTRDGYFNARIEGGVCGYAPSGLLVLQSPEKPVFNQHGAMVGKLSMLTGDMPDKIVVADDKGLLLGKGKQREETQTDTTLEYSNALNVFRLEKETLLLSSLDTLQLPPTRYRYPGEESDLALADQVYLLKTAVIVADTLYLLAYSEENFWVERISLNQYRK